MVFIQNQSLEHKATPISGVTSGSMFLTEGRLLLPAWVDLASQVLGVGPGVGITSRPLELPGTFFTSASIRRSTMPVKGKIFLLCFLGFFIQPP